jgi:hypothetical protein
MLIKISGKKVNDKKNNGTESTNPLNNFIKKQYHTTPVADGF